MIWQDAVLSAGGFVLAALLWPIIRDSEATVPQRSSIPTATVLAAFALTYVTLDLWLAAGATATSALAWTLIALLRAPDND